MAAWDRSNDTQDLTYMGWLLLEWYQRHRRDLPWRETEDPYAIWVAEIMLQQTRVETVIAYFERFLTHFPTVEALAAAPLDQVLKAWEGMGYYARARNLHRAACHVVEELGGQLPPTPEGLLLLSGVGQYTAAAIASIAFGYDAIALDGNLQRILCRLFAVDDDPRRSNTQRHLEKLARAMLPAGQASDFNQALMDLGSAICTANQPHCLLCPLIGLCEAQSEGIQNELPIRTTRGQRPHRDVTAAVLRDGRDHLLITQRLLDGLLGGLWEFPGGKRRPGEALQDCLRREIREELCIDIQVGELLCTIEHSFTHFFMTLYAYECQWISGEPQCLGCRDLRWVTLEELGAFAFPAADQRIIAYLLENHQ